MKCTEASRGIVPGICALGWVKGMHVRLQCVQPHPPSSTPLPWRDLSPREERISGGSRGHISQARARGLFWFEFPLCSLPCNMKFKKKKKKKKKERRNLPRQALPPAFFTFSPTTHSFPSSLSYTYTHTHTHTPPPLATRSA